MNTTAEADGTPLIMNTEDKLKLFYDGSCGMCNETMHRLNQRDRHNNIHGIDIAHPNFDKAKWGFDEGDDLQGSMHAILPSGEVVTGMEALRQASYATGRGWMLSWTKLPGVSCLSDRAYMWFAKRRHRLTGRVLNCDNETCKI